MRKYKTLVVLILTTSIIALFLSLIFLAGGFSYLQARLADSLYGGYPSLDAIVIVAIDDASIQDIGHWPWDRSAFADLQQQLASAKVVGYDIGFFEAADGDEDFADALRATNNTVLGIQYTNFSVVGSVLYGESLLLPEELLSDQALNLGYVNLITSNDGVTRSVDHEVQGVYSSFAVAIYDAYWRTHYIPPSNPQLINYVGPPGTFVTYSVKDVLADDFDTSTFANKIVLVGATAPSLHDTFFVPTSHGIPMSGVEIQANVLQMMITENYLLSEPAIAVILSLFLFAAGISFVVFLFGLIRAGIVVFISIFIYIFTCISLFDTGLVMNLFYPPIALGLFYTASAGYLYLYASNEKRKVLGAFEKYVSPVVIRELLAHPEYLKLGGERKTITLFFSDIRGFTAISETLSPEELVSLLNEYLSEMTDIIISREGVVDKFMGDAIMAFWGAPLTQPNHARLAAEASLTMIDALQKMQKQWTARGVPVIDIGIGLHTGEVVIGNMGSKDRFDYTAIGDSVNLASRLEGLNKIYGTRILITESVKEGLGRDFAHREIDKVRVKGKKNHIRIFELLGKGSLSGVQEKNHARYERALHMYYKGEFADAVRELGSLQDAAAKNLSERCAYLLTHRPASWDGIWEMTTK